MRVPLPAGERAEGAIPFTDSLPAFRTIMIAFTVCPIVLACGRISIEARSGALLRRTPFGAATGPSSGPSFPEPTVTPPMGIARRTVAESAGEAETVSDTKSRAPAPASASASTALCQ